jgi:hypothetical protein
MSRLNGGYFRTTSVGSICGSSLQKCTPGYGNQNAEGMDRRPRREGDGNEVALLHIVSGNTLKCDEPTQEILLCIEAEIY